MLFTRKGLDINFAKKQKWWSDLSTIILTDDETMRRLVEYVFRQSAEAKISEIQFSSQLILKDKDIAKFVDDLAKRQGTIEHFLKSPQEIK